MRQRGALLTALLLTDRAHAVVNDQGSIKADILGRYGDKAVRPSLAYACSADSPPPADEVETQLYVDRFHSLNQVELTWGVDGYQRAWWCDPRLAFNATNCTKSLAFTYADMQRVWLPDIYWDKAIRVSIPGAREQVTNGAGQLFTVSPSGCVVWSRQVYTTLACAQADLSYLPYDTLVCSLTIGLYSQTAADVVIIWKQGEDAISNWDGECLARWAPSSHSFRNLQLVFATGTYAYVMASVAFTRIPSQYLLYFLMPAILMVAISYLGFWIDPSATPARVTLGVITILVVLQNFDKLGASLGSASGTTSSWLSRFILGSIFFNVVAFFEQVHTSTSSRADHWSRR